MRVLIHCIFLLLIHGVATIRVKKAAVSNRQRLWPNGIIPYVINDTFPGELQRLFHVAMRHWENHTCLSFIPRRSFDRDYIIFTTDKCGCCSYVGRKGDGGQIISIGKNCDKFGIIVHELGHVIGFSHEHTRPDRDKFVEIFRNNIQDGQDYNFDKAKADEIDSRGETYDYHSIMHYARDTFARSAYLDTILPLKPMKGERPKIGQRTKLSDGDIRQTNKMYECPSCLITLLTPTGDIISSNNSLHCNWRIITSIGQRIALNITTKMLVKSTTKYCQNERNNYIEIRDGISRKSKLITKICFSTEPRTLISTKNSLFIHISTSKVLPEIIIGKYKTTCGGIITTEYGLLSSPNYPEAYPINIDCKWNIIVPEDYRIAVIFRYFNLESHKDCSYDRLELYESSIINQTNLIKRLCGQDVPKYIVTNTSNQIIIRFISDSSIQKTGFYIEFFKEINECEKNLHKCEHKCVDKIGGYECVCSTGYTLNKNGKSCDSCGGDISAINGNIIFPNNSYNNTANKECTWTLNGNINNRIVLNITALDKITNEVINVKIIDEEEHEIDFKKMNSSHYLYLSTKNQIRLVLSSNTIIRKELLFINYTQVFDECTDNNGNCEHICKKLIDKNECLCHSGYTLSSDGFSCNQNECYHQIYEPTATVTSPGFPDYYPTNKNCTWHIITTPGQRIVFTFSFFDIEDHYTCKYDNLAVYDGCDKSSKLLGVFCGNSIPDTITSSGNQLLLELISDDTQPRKGFNASYTSICGGRLKADSTTGFVYSDAKYGDDDYSKMTNCKWEIYTDDGMNIKLQFLKFDLEYETDCQYDYVAIYDGTVNSSENLIDKYCGDQIPSSILSRTNSLFIEFVTDDNIEDKGFLFEYSSHSQKTIQNEYNLT